jgi:hypothetical protein
LPDALSEIFLREGLDKGFQKSGSDLPVGQFAVTNYGVLVETAEAEAD